MIYHAPGTRLYSHHVRVAAFATRWRGLDPEEVRAYLHRVADELDSLHRELAIARTDAERAKQGLRQWQTRHIGCRFSDPAQSAHGRTTNRGPRMSDPHWVIHLPTTVSTFDKAAALVSALRDSLSHVTVLDFGEVTLSEEDHQGVRHQVYCNRLGTDSARCTLRHGHDHSCASSHQPTLPTSSASPT